VLSREFRAVARALVANTLSQLHSNVARQRFLHARTLRQTANDLKLPLHVVRSAGAEVEFCLGLKSTLALAA
jgi:hypothetical protein